MGLYIFSGVLYLLAIIFVGQAEIDAALGAAVVATGLMIYNIYNKKRIRQINSQEAKVSWKSKKTNREKTALPKEPLKENAVAIFAEEPPKEDSKESVKLSLNDRYATFESLYKRFLYLKDADLKLSAAQAFLEFCQNEKITKFNSFILKNKDIYPYSASSARDVEKKVIDEVPGIENRQKRMLEFESKLKAIPLAQIELTEAVKLKKQLLSEMPEIKTVNITKNFSKDKMPAFVVIDVETTGLKAHIDEIVEISAIKYIEFEPVEAFTTLIKPRKDIPQEATKIHGITDDMVLNAPYIEQVSDCLKAFVGKLPIFGYNVAFDLKFLYVNNINFLEKRKIYDVLEFCRKTYKNELNYFSLEDVCEQTNIVRRNSHHSLSDCYATGLVLDYALYWLFNY